MKLLNLLFVFLLFSAFKCSPNEEVVPVFEIAPVIGVAMPEQVVSNEPIPIEVTIAVTNSCGSFGSLELAMDNNSFEFTAKRKYVGKNCTEAPMEVKSNTTLFLATPGTYTFRFWQGDDKPYLVKTLRVNK